MAPKKAKKGTPAPTSKVPVKRKDGQPTRAEKKAVNKAVMASANDVVKVTVEEKKQEGVTIAAPHIADIIGKPVEWSESLSEALFALISTGHGMEAIAKIDGMPTVYRMLRWLGEDTHPFKTVYARGKELLVPMYEELTQKMAMNSNTLVLTTRKQIITKDGDRRWVTEYREVDNVERSKLAIATTQWTLGHLKPKKHGRAPDSSGDKPNEQLEGLFAALKAGPKE